MSGASAATTSFQHAVDQVKQRVPFVTILAIEHALRDVSGDTNMQNVQKLLYSNILSQ